MKRLWLFLSLLLSMTFIATQSAFAARIYNDLPVPIVAKGLDRIQTRKLFEIRIQPGERSPSLSWTSATWVELEAHEVTCRMSFGSERHMQGGNYMTIGVRGHDVVCTLCGSSHEVMAQHVYHNWAGWKSTRSGC